MLDAGKKKKDASSEKKQEVVDPKMATAKSALMAGLGLSSFVGVGILNPDPQFLAMMGTFTLAAIAGYQSVWSVTPSLHTPLMSVTNAISGLTAAGGLLILGGGVFPHSFG